MDQKLILTGLALGLFYVLWRRTKRLDLSEDAPPELRALLTWNNPSEAEKTIAAAEAFLEKNPEDLSRRMGILLHLAYGERRDPKKLRLHTLELIKRLPSAFDIPSYNDSEFFRNPTYRDEIVEALSDQLGKGFLDAEIHGNLAWMLGRAAIPIADPIAFREWTELDPNTPVPEKLDDDLLERATEHYRTAIKLSPDPFDKATHAESLATLLSDAGQLEEAIRAFQIASELNSNEEYDRAGLLVNYGECLIKMGRFAGAREKLSIVRENDTEGFEGGPGCKTIEAEILLGHIASNTGNYQTAAEHLIHSTDVQRCCHSTTRGFPTYLAKELVEHEPKAVSEFCDIVLNNFTPGASDIEKLRSAAIAKLKA